MTSRSPASAPSTSSSPVVHIAALFAVLGLGVYFRWTGLSWGLPWLLHIDERLFIVEKSFALEASLRHGLPDPGISSYGILPLWLTLFARKLFAASVMDSGAPIHGNLEAATALLARGLSATAGAATILVVYFWGMRWGSTVGLTAAACIAGFPALVQASHFGTVESLLLLLLSLTLLAAERLAESPSRGRAVLAGLLFGLALSVKAPAAALFLPLVHAARRRTLEVLAVAMFVVVVLNPRLPGEVLLQLNSVWGGAPLGNPAPGEVAEAGPTTRPSSDAAPASHTTLLGNISRAYSSTFHDWTLAYAQDRPILTELTKILPFAVGVAAESLAFLGLASLVRRRKPNDVRLLLFCAFLLLVTLPARARTIRFIIPLFSAWAVLAAQGAAVLGALLSRAGLNSWFRWAPSLLLAGLTLAHGAAFTRIYKSEDARVAAARWLDAEVAPLEIVTVEDPPGYGPPLGSPTPEIVRQPLRYQLLWNGFYVIHEKRSPEERQLHVQETLARTDVLVLSEGHRAEFLGAGELRPVERSFYEDLDAGKLPFSKVKEFKTYPGLGPWIFPDDGAEVLMRVFDHPRIEIWRRTREEGSAAEEGAAPNEAAPEGSAP